MLLHNDLVLPVHMVVKKSKSRSEVTERIQNPIKYLTWSILQK